MTTFKQGDKVQVVDRVEHEVGYHNVWFAGGMDRYVGDSKTYTVRTQNSMGVYFKEDGGIFGFPSTSLKLVEELIPDGLTPVQRRCKKLWNQSNWVKQHPQQAY